MSVCPQVILLSGVFQFNTNTNNFFPNNRKVEFLEDFGTSVDEVSVAQDEYQKLAQKLQNDRQAKAAAQMAQQQASATNATTETR